MPGSKAPDRGVSCGCNVLRREAGPQDRFVRVINGCLILMSTGDGLKYLESRQGSEGAAGVVGGGAIAHGGRYLSGG